MIRSDTSALRLRARIGVQGLAGVPRVRGRGLQGLTRSVEPVALYLALLCIRVLGIVLRCV